MSQSNVPVVLLTNRDGLKELVNLDNVARINEMCQGGSCVHFVGGAGGLEVQESPDRILPLLIEQQLQTVKSAMAAMGGLEGIADLFGAD